MKELPIEKRIEIYEKVKEDIEPKIKFKITVKRGLCSLLLLQLYHEFNAFYKFGFKDITDIFPELLKVKPKNIYRDPSGLWWSPINYKTRLKKVNEMIALAEAKLINQEHRKIYHHDKT